MNDSNNNENELSTVKVENNLDNQTNSNASTPTTTGVNIVSETPATTGVNIVSETPATTGVNFVPETPATTGVNIVPETPATTGVSIVPETPATTGVNIVPETPATTGVNFVPEQTTTTPEVGVTDTPTNPTSPVIVAPPTPQVELASPIPLASTPVEPAPESEKIGVANDTSPTPASDNQTNNTVAVDDDELLKAFIGNNYDKITTKPFNIAGFFFSTLYMFYRKMFGYAILAFLVQILVSSFSKIFALGLIFNVVIGLFVNKIYVSFAKKKIATIKSNNAGKTIDELKAICVSKGGTSVGQLILGLFTQFVIAVAVLLLMVLIGIGSFISEFINFGTLSSSGGESGGNTTITGDKILVEDVKVSGSICTVSCNYVISDVNDEMENYEFNALNEEVFEKINLYTDYIKLDIYYVNSGSTKTIVDYKIYLRSTNEDISNVETENELREKIGLFAKGKHTETLSYVQFNGTGFGYDNDVEYVYTNYVFLDNNNNLYDMKYIGNNLNLIEGQSYSVTFEVREGTFDYEYVIESIN